MVHYPIVTELTSTQYSASAFISVDGVKCRIYDIIEERNKIIGIIESKNGAKFTITSIDNLKKTRYDRTTSFFVDGLNCDDYVTLFNSSKYRTPPNSPSRHLTSSGTDTSPVTKRLYFFNRPRLTSDEDEFLVNEQLGTIQIKLFRSKSTGKEAPEYEYEDSQQSLVNEEVKKITLNHQIGFTAPTRVKEHKRHYINFIDEEDEPQFTFEFRYLSYDVLVIKGYLQEDREVSATPTQEGPEDEPEEEESDNDEYQEQVDKAELLRLEAALNLAKAEVELQEKKLAIAKKRLAERASGGNKKRRKGIGSLRIKEEDEVDQLDLGVITLDD